MKITESFKVKEWFISSVLTFTIYELLWNILIIHTWRTIDWGIYFFDLIYCSLFVALSMWLGNLFNKFQYFKVFTLQRQLYLCILIFMLNMMLAFLFEFSYEIIILADTEEQYHGGIYLFCFIASMLTFVHNIGRYYNIISEQREQLFLLKKQIIKNKLDPHFVFNSLSVLTELIHIDPKRAEKYTTHFSRIYRHILYNIDKEYASLSESLECVKDYVSLQQSRVEGIINLDIKDFIVKEDDMLYPLALLTLIENAIKHNTPYNKGSILSITIRRENNELQISNNINTDTNCYRSFGIGIQSLSEQYKIENKPQPKIAVKDGIYEVRIAILKIRNIHA